MITPERQKEICETIRTLCKSSEWYDSERQHMLFVGVIIALPTELPPHWQMNIQCGRTDRIMLEQLNMAMPLMD